MSKTQGRSQRKKILWAAIVILVIAAAAAWWLWKCGGTCKLGLSDASSLQDMEGQFIIAVAPFWASDPKADEEGRSMQRLTGDALREELEAEESVTILTEGIEEPPRTDEEAKTLGEAHHADIVIWGQVFVFQEGLEIRPYFTTLTSLRWIRKEEQSMGAFFTLPEQEEMQKTKVAELRNVALVVAAVYYQGEPDKALRLLEKIDPPTVESLRWQGNIYYMLSKQEEAADLYLRAIAQARRERYERLKPKLGEGRETVAAGEAPAEPPESLTLDPKDSMLYADLGWVRLEQVKYEEARAEFQKAAELDPGNSDAHDGLGWTYCYGEKYEYEKALAAFQKVITLDPHYAEVRNAVGWLHYHEGEYEKAVAEFEMPVVDLATGNENPAIKSEYSDVYIQLAYSLALHRAGRGEEAQTPIKELAKLFRGDEKPGWAAPLAFFYLGEITEGDVLKAAEADDEELEQEQKCEAYYYMGMTHLLGVGAQRDASQPEREKKAREHFEKCLATGATTVPEYRSAERELKQL
ncbi:MAG: tetratricopeptide repeat protein [Acidobacteriota bacterium]|nr:MAG: tetratricopeptide repeat protein [Acidobacteriota bacterium]